MADLIVYRTMVLIGNKRKILEIMGKYHARYTENTPGLHLPARQRVVELTTECAPFSVLKPWIWPLGLRKGKSRNSRRRRGQGKRKENKRKKNLEN